MDKNKLKEIQDHLAKITEDLANNNVSNSREYMIKALYKEDVTALLQELIDHGVAGISI